MMAGAVVLVLVSVFAWVSAPDPERIPGAGRWFSVLPPVLAVTLALATRSVFFSLAAGVLSAGFLTHIPAEPFSAIGWGRGFLSTGMFVWTSLASKTNLQILAFVTLMMAMIAVILKAGGFDALVNALSRFAKGPASAQVVASLLGIAVFIDDYANTMIVGPAMRPLTDRYRVSREKLAFIVDATSAPVAGLAVVSTWIGYEVGLFAQIGQALRIPKDGYGMFFDALPFRFYCWLMMMFVLWNGVLGRDFGPMARAERRARERGWLLAPDAKPLTSKALATVSRAENARASGWTAVVPLIVLFGWLLRGLWLDGGGASLFREDPLSVFSPQTWMQVITRAEHNIPILTVAAALGLAVAAICALTVSRLRTSQVLYAMVVGAQGSLFPITILLLAWSLKAGCDALGTGPFLVATLGASISPLWLPAAVFLVACVTSFATGTSWGTMAILLPVTTPLAFAADGNQYGVTTVLCLAAVLDGAIFGDHCSPISDTTLMSSIASHCDHIAHTTTQLPYSLFVGGLALIFGYLAVPALRVSFATTMGLATAAIVLTLLLSPKTSSNPLHK
jgi:Na+/H+ antiporter NhaC